MANNLHPEQIKIIAQACHEQNKAWCALNGDMSQLPWDSCPDWQKEASIKGVEFLYNECNADPVNISSISPSVLHDQWKKEKIKDGWTFGEVKDPEKKTHPCLVEFHELPYNQQVKDKLLKNTFYMMFTNLIRDIEQSQE